MSRDTGSVSRIITSIALFVAVLITLGLPLGYFIVSYRHLVGILDAQAELSARSVSVVVVASPTMWQYEQVRFAEILERRPLERVPERRRLLDLSGNLVAEHTDLLTPPLITRGVSVFDAGRPVARIEITRSLFPILIQSVLVGSAGMLAGFIVYITFRNLPLRAIRKAYARLEESEARYRTLYDSMNEGVVLNRLLSDNFGAPCGALVLDMNPAAGLIFGKSVQECIGESSFELFGSEFVARMPEIGEVVARKGSMTFEHEVSSLELVLRISVFSPGDDLFALLIDDVTEKKRTEEQILKLAYYDILTGLPNRQLLQDRLDQAIAVASRDGGRVAVMFLDLDRFKIINDTLGHIFGDMLLVQASIRFRQGLRSSDTLARIGGDEFVILIPYAAAEVNVAHIASHLLELAVIPYDLGSRQVTTSVSIGIALYPEDGLDSQGLLSSADLAMYAAKEQGRNGYNFFSLEMNAKAHKRLELELNLRRGLEREEFFLEFQPVVNARDGRVVGAEALVRWAHPEWGRVMPGAFVSVAEETNLIVPLGEWVLRTVCCMVNEWRGAGVPQVRVSVNVSGMQFRQRNFIETVADIIAETGADPHWLELELTETSLMENADETIKSLFRLKELDISIAVDDFGAGYSSLTYLKDFPIDRLKIDRSFIRDVCERPGDRAIVEAIIALANSLKLFIVAEGVEEKGQSAFLVSRNCDEIQGYFYHRPLSEEQLLELLRSQDVAG